MKINVTREEWLAITEIKKNMGFVTGEQLRILSYNKNLKVQLMCLIRCGRMRPIVILQDTAFLIDIITREGTDYVRDVSLTCDSFNWLKSCVTFNVIGE